MQQSRAGSQVCSDRVLLGRGPSAARGTQTWRMKGTSAAAPVLLQPPAPPPPLRPRPHLAQEPRTDVVGTGAREQAGARSQRCSFIHSSSARPGSARPRPGAPSEKPRATSVWRSRPPPLQTLLEAPRRTDTPREETLTGWGQQIWGQNALLKTEKRKPRTWRPDTRCTPHRSPRGWGTESTSLSWRGSLATWISTVLASEPGEEKRKACDDAAASETLWSASGARPVGTFSPATFLPGLRTGGHVCAQARPRGSCGPNAHQRRTRSSLGALYCRPGEHLPQGPAP